MTEHEIIIETLIKLLKATPNDGVKLMLTEPEKLMKKLDKLDLTPVTELKRGSNGTFEMKLIDKLSVIKLIYEMLGSEGSTEHEATKSLINALYEASGVNGCDELED